MKSENYRTLVSSLLLLWVRNPTGLLIQLTLQVKTLKECKCQQPHQYKKRKINSNTTSPNDSPSAQSSPRILHPKRIINFKVVRLFAIAIPADFIY